MDTTELRVLEILRRPGSGASPEAAAAYTAGELAELVRGAERMRRSEAAGEIASAIAQELRNPLFGISAAAQLLRFRSHEDPVLETNVGRILREVERLNRMTTSLLELGRPIQPQFTRRDPDEVWDGVLENHRGALESRSLQLRRTRARPPASCNVDGGHLTQALAHILVNAVDAAPEASDLALESTTSASGGWECRLTNAGAPVPADSLPRVFDLFFSTKPGGMGLGLALARRIIEAHRGVIGMESGESGTTVSVILPPAA